MKAGFCILFLLTSITCVPQNISLSFSASYYCEEIDIDSVLIKNKTNNTDTLLHNSEPVLYTLIEDFISDKDYHGNAFCFPNPYFTNTNIVVSAPETDMYIINAYDITGNKVAGKNAYLIAESHSFSFTGQSAGSYYITISSSSFAQTIKLIQLGNSTGNESNIIKNNLNRSFSTDSYYHPPSQLRVKEKSSCFICDYEIGDELMFIVYITDFNNVAIFKTKLDNPTISKNYLFEFKDTLPDTPEQLFTIGYENEISWTWTSVYNANGYKFNTENYYHTAIDNGEATQLTQSGLICDTVHHLYVWAYNACGKSEVLTMTESTTTCTWSCGNKYLYGNHEYSTIKINNQCWFAENLNIGTRINNQLSQNDNCHDIKKYCYGNLTANCDKYGGLYRWSQAMCGDESETKQGICPQGWRVATDEDFKELETSLGMSELLANSTGWRGSNQGSKLAGKQYMWQVGDLIQSLEFGASGFDALPGGYVGLNSNFIGDGFTSKWWTSTNYYELGWYRRISYNNKSVFRNNANKNKAFYVRCVLK